jgi:uncharacterized membrane protein HdeD (DUF308 family)
MNVNANVAAQRDSPLLDQWWALIVRGALAILFGVLSIIWPHLTLIALIALFAAYALADGVISLIAAFRSKRYGWLLFGGLLSLAAGILTILFPAAAALALVIFIGAWAIVRGALDIALAFNLREETRETRYEWLLGLSGIFSIIFGFFVIVWPAAGALAIVGVIAGFAIVLGALLIAAGIRQHRLRDQLRPTGPTARPA